MAHWQVGFQNKTETCDLKNTHTHNWLHRILKYSIVSKIDDWFILSIRSELFVLNSMWVVIDVGQINKFTAHLMRDVLVVRDGDGGGCVCVLRVGVRRGGAVRAVRGHQLHPSFTSVLLHPVSFFCSYFCPLKLLLQLLPGLRFFSGPVARNLSPSRHTLVLYSQRTRKSGQNTRFTHEQSGLNIYEIGFPVLLQTRKSSLQYLWDEKKRRTFVQGSDEEEEFSTLESASIKIR